MTRQRDRIDVMLDECATIGMELAWADLRALIFDREGVDIERGKHFAVMTKRIRGSGNRATHAFVAIPRDAATPDEVMQRGFMSLYGELPLWASDIVRTAADRQERPVFAVPLSSAMKVLN